MKRSKREVDLESQLVCGVIDVSKHVDRADIDSVVKVVHGGLGKAGDAYYGDANGSDGRGFITPTNPRVII